jgi:hypothetical protein
MSDVASAAVPDGVVVEVPVGATDHSPSQERLTRIAGMLRDAEQSAPVTFPRSGGRGRRRHDQQEAAGVLADRRARR